MFCENLRTIRKASGISQKELAEQLHVVRQTISKWEKGLSVPDADMLIRIAEIFEKSVSELLGGPIEAPADADTVAQKLEQINLQLAESNRRSRRIWKTVAGIILVLTAAAILMILLNFSTSYIVYERSATQMITKAQTQTASSANLF